MRLYILLALLGRQGTRFAQAASAPEDSDGSNFQLPGADTFEVVDYNITGTPCKDTAEANEVWCDLWVMNAGDERSAYIEEGGQYALVNVEAVNVATDEAGAATQFTLYTHGVPNYRIPVTQSVLDTLNGRPLASRDFVNGTAAVALGDVIEFGEDLGYLTSFCEHGFWPPGPECPENVQKEMVLPTSPSEPATVEDANQCFMAVGLVGVFLNGVSMYSWADFFSYNDEDVWHNQAAYYEIYDLDVCVGHAAVSQYHHHTYSQCVQDLAEDDGASGHSPIIGMTPDGFYHYGLYQDTGVKAQSCWKERDYSDPDDPLGCGGTGERTCVLVDNLQPSLGTVDAPINGPTVDEEIFSLSQNRFVAISGSYYEDWYFDEDCYAQGGEYLDEHNGHSHGDLGYHYHATEEFPWFVGPTTYYGQVNVEGWDCGGYSWDQKVQDQIDRLAAADSDEAPPAGLDWLARYLAVATAVYLCFS